jgi:hypothetical protein
MYRARLRLSHRTLDNVTERCKFFRRDPDRLLGARAHLARRRMQLEIVLIKL